MRRPTKLLAKRETNSLTDVTCKSIAKKVELTAGIGAKTNDEDAKTLPFKKPATG